MTKNTDVVMWRMRRHQDGHALELVCFMRGAYVHLCINGQPIKVGRVGQRYRASLDQILRWPQVLRGDGWRLFEPEEV